MNEMRLGDMMREYAMEGLGWDGYEVWIDMVVEKLVLNELVGEVVRWLMVRE